MLVDIGDIALLLVEPLPRELASLVKTVRRCVSRNAKLEDINTHSLLSFETTLSMASSEGLLSPYMSVFASR